MKKGILTVLSGFSGSGKGTLLKALTEKYPYALSVSATTRDPREGEVEGRDYFFLTRESFESMISQNALIEWAEYVGNYYGTPRAYVEEKLAQGIDVILEIEIQGALHVKEQYPQCLLIFLTPPSGEELQTRLVNRGTESPEVVARRLHRASEEASFMDQYEYLAVNDDLDCCVEQVHEIIQNPEVREAFAMKKQQAFVQRMKKELSIF